MAKQDDWTRITLRLPGELHQRLTDSAGPRSVNAEIVERLDRSYYETTEDNFLESLASGRFVEPLPRGLAARIQASAEENGRSVEDEVIYRLEDGFSPNRSSRQLEVFYQSLLEGVVTAAGDRIPQEMQRLLKPLQPIGEHPDYYKNLLRQIGEAPVAGAPNSGPRTTDLERDVQTLVTLMDTELHGGEITKVPEMRTSLGERLSEAIGDRTVEAMKLVVRALREAGLLRGDEKAASQVVDAAQLFKKQA